MSEIKTNLNGLSVGVLKKLISDIPDDCTIDVWNIGGNGVVDGCELEIITYEYSRPDININIKAASGFH